jgi:hypothetical protein
MQLRDVFAVRAHWGWLHALLGRVRHSQAASWLHLRPAIDTVLLRMHRRTRRLSTHFDALHGTDTFSRMDVPVSDDPADAVRWGYSAINHDFFREIMRSIPTPLAPYTFVDIGSGKGAAVLMASEFPFVQLQGVELSADLVALAKSNVVQFNQTSGKSLAPVWTEGDFFKWAIPHQAQLFFFNNPFPEHLTLPAIQRLEQSLAEHFRPVLLVFRKAPQSTGDYLHQSKVWKPLRLAPYWRVYQAIP